MTTDSNARLIKLLRAAYAARPAELRSLTVRVYGKEVAAALTGDSADALATSLVEEIERRNLDWPVLLADLRDNTPLVADEVAEFARQLGISVPGESAGRPDMPLSDAWFRARLAEATRQLDRRYILGLLGQDAHVHVPIEQMLDAVVRGPGLQKRWEDLLDDLSAQAKYGYDLEAAMDPARAKALPGELRDLAFEAGAIRLSGTAPLDLGAVSLRVEQLACELEAMWMHTFRPETADKGGEASETLSVASQHPREHSERVGDARRWLQRALSALKELREFLQGPEVQAAIAGVLAVTGPAGSGKSHLLAHEATTWLDEGRPAVLILGEHFHGAGPATAEILRILGEPGRTFWDDLERLAASRGCKAVVMIDALNETDGSTFWKRHLNGLLAFMKSRPYIAFVFSVRTEYIHDCLSPEALKGLPVAVHGGFSGIAPDQLNKVFHAYELDGPRAIPVQAELLNPLMLHLVCRGLQDKGSRGLDDLPNGALALWRFVVADLNRRLATPERLDFDRKADVVGKALRVIGAALWKVDKVALPRTALKGPVQKLLKKHHCGSQLGDLLRELKREGMLAEQLGRDDGSGEMLRFQFQRLGETFQAEAILEKLGAGADPGKAFLTFLDSIGTKHVRRWQSLGVIQMMSLHLGETHKLEAFDIARGHVMEEDVRVQWRLSLPLRSTASVGTECVRCFEEWLRSAKVQADELYGLLLQLALRPDHPLNADFLHGLLQMLDMPTRDTGWSAFVYYSDESDGALTNIRTWIDVAANADTLDSEVARLAAIVLAWSFTTSQRFVRDRNTKSLVRLLSAAPDLAAPLVRQFAQVNDQYVVERVVAAAYGAATRVNDPGAVEALCLAVWECFFEAGTPPQHILLRDYARSIVELASHRGLLPPGVDLGKTRPPYAIVPFRENLPDEESLKLQLARTNGQYGPISAILSSMDQRMGDFWSYVMGANYRFDPEWSCRPRTGGPSIRERWRLEFEDSIDADQLTYWRVYVCPSAGNMDAFEPGSDDVDEELSKLSDAELAAMLSEDQATLGVNGDEQSVEELMIPSSRRSIYGPVQRMNDHLAALEATFSDQQRMLYRRMERSSHHMGHDSDEDVFPREIARRWMFQRILDLGWSEARMGALDDSRIGLNHSRSAHKAERLGKKYQWLAWHGFLAALQDAFEPRTSGDWASVTPNGFPTRQRDIDPTCLTSQTQGREHLNGVDRCWWCPVDYTRTITIDPAAVWRRSATDIPQLQRLLEVSDPMGRRWLVLNIHREWEQDMPIGRRGLEALARRYHALVRSAVVRVEEVEPLGGWLGEQRMMGRWFPEAESPDARLRECWWHPAIHRLRHEEDETWRSLDRAPNRAPYPWRLVPSEVTLLYEDATVDCSIESTFDIQLPAPWLVAQLGLTHGPADGTWVDADGEVLLMDPSLQHPGPSALLMRRDVLERLVVLGYTLIWTGLGELLGEEGGERRYVSATSAAVWLENETWRGKQWQHSWSEREEEGEE